MDFFRTAANPWGEQILTGIAWDVMWLAIIASAVFVVGHALWMAARGGTAVEAAGATVGVDGGDGPDGGAGPVPAGVPERVERHTVAARVFHWLMSIAMFALLITAFVPVIGVQFAWVTPHWIAGLILVAALAYHIVHATFFQDFWAMWVRPAEFGPGMEELKHALGAGSGEAPKSGKYPFDHQLYHHLAAGATGLAVITGLLMMTRVDNPFVERNPYLMGDGAWGLVYVMHGVAGVALIGLVAAHVYFAVRPEKRWITWSMLRGWIDREHYLAHHDPDRWEVTGGAEPGRIESAAD